MSPDRRALHLAFAAATTGPCMVNLNSAPRSDTGLASAVIATQRNPGRNIGTALAALAALAGMVLMRAPQLPTQGPTPSRGAVPAVAAE